MELCMAEKDLKESREERLSRERREGQKEFLDMAQREEDVDFNHLLGLNYRNLTVEDIKNYCKRRGRSF